MISPFRLRGFYPLRQTFPDLFDYEHLKWWMVRNPVVNYGLGSSPFARRYLGNRCFFLFLRVLRCFSSPGYLLWSYGFTSGYLRITTGEFPHSEICGSKAVCALPQLIAACHVLRRLLVPRHPPYALIHLTKSELLTQRWVRLKLIYYVNVLGKSFLVSRFYFEIVNFTPFSFPFGKTVSLKFVNIVFRQVLFSISS